MAWSVSSCEVQTGGAPRQAVETGILPASFRQLGGRYENLAACHQLGFHQAIQP